MVDTMMERAVGMTKEECLARWKAAAPKRRAYAKQVISGKKQFPAHLPMWKQYDLKAEIQQIRDEQEKQREEYEAAQRRKRERLNESGQSSVEMG